MLIRQQMGSLKMYLEKNIYQFNMPSQWELNFLNKDFSSSPI